MCMERRRFSQTMTSEWQTAFAVSHKSAMVCLAHCRQELQHMSWKTARLFLEDRDQDQARPNVQDQDQDQDFMIQDQDQDFDFSLGGPRNLVSRTTSLNHIIPVSSPATAKSKSTSFKSKSAKTTWLRVLVQKVKVHTLDKAPLRSETPQQTRSGMTRVLKGSHSFTCTPTRSSAIRMSHSCLCLPCRSWYSFTDPGGMEG